VRRNSNQTIKKIIKKVLICSKFRTLSIITPLGLSMLIMFACINEAPTTVKLLSDTPGINYRIKYPPGERQTFIKVKQQVIKDFCFPTLGFMA